MKIIYKSSIKSALLILPLLTYAMAGNVYAQAPTNDSQRPSDRAAKAICERIASTSSSDVSKISARIDTMHSGFETRKEALAANQKEIDQKIQDFRTNIRTRFDDKVMQLANRPDLTDKQKTAIDKYKTDMLAAETIRETAVDSARSEYRTALLVKLTEHQTTLKDAATTLQASIEKAFQDLSQACDSGASPLETLRTEIKSAREEFKKSLNSSDQARSNIKQLAATRRSAVASANQDFKKTASELSRTLARELKTEKDSSSR